MDYDELKRNLQSEGANIRCADLKSWLENAGFTVRKAGNAGHHVFIHNDIESFSSSSFNCGHGKNSKILKSYIRNILRIINQYEDELRKIIVQKK